MYGEAKMKMSQYFVFAQSAYLVAGIGGQVSVENPVGYLFHVPSAGNTSEINKHVAPEFGGVRTNNLIMFIYPQNGGHIGDGKEFSKLVFGVNEHRVSDAFGEGNHRINVFIQSNGDDRKIVPSQGLVKFLPPGQVKCASSPTGKSHQKTPSARPFG